MASQLIPEIGHSAGSVRITGSAEAFSRLQAPHFRDKLAQQMVIEYAESLDNGHRSVRSIVGMSLVQYALTKERLDTMSTEGFYAMDENIIEDVNGFNING